MSDAEIIITPDGTTARHIHSDELTAMTEGLGDQTIRRASNVEPTDELSQRARDAVWTQLFPAGLPCLDDSGPDDVVPPNKWWADMHPVGGPVLGPFDTRQMALTEEVAWLREHNIPTCETCGNNDNSNDGTPDGDPTSD